MISCPACGKENDESALECRRCRAPLREEDAGSGDASSVPEAVCPRCDSANDASAERCLTCGHRLQSEPEEPGEEPLDKTPADPYAPDVSYTVSDLAPLALSAEEAAEAMGQKRSSPRVVMAVGGSIGVDAPPPPPPSIAAPARFVPDAAVVLEKPCAQCGAANPAAAKFCFDCGTPFGKKPAPATDAPAADEPVELGEADALGPGIFEEVSPPFRATIVVQNGASAGAAFPLPSIENRVGTQAALVQLDGDPYVAPHAATLTFVEDRLVLRDEGSTNGVYRRLREPAPLAPGDQFSIGDRLLRYDGPIELPAPVEGDPPVLGTPRPQGAPIVRFTELLAYGRTGRSCHRAGPVVVIGRSGCDLNLPSAERVAARHAEVRIDASGAAQLVDLGDGVWLRLPPRGSVELQEADELQVGDQQLRLEVS